MFDNKSAKTAVESLRSRRPAPQYRLHHFPPLRKSWEMPAAGNTASLDPAEYQKQLMDGFQEGLDKGYQQGLEQGKDAGYTEGARLGYEEGMKKGQKEGRDAGRVMFSSAAKPLNGILDELKRALEEHEKRRREELLQLVEKVTRQVIRCELALQPTQLLALVEEALTSLPALPSQIKVLMNPQEFARINDAEPERVREWGLVADAEMAEGECHIITENTEMDVGCEHRLEQCMDVLKSTLLPEDKND